LLKPFISRVVACSGALAMLLSSGGAVAQAPSLIAFPRIVEAPDTTTAADAGPYACTTPMPIHTYKNFHCYSPADIMAAYGVDKVHALGNAGMGSGKTIVLVDSYGSPTAANDLQFFHDAFFKGLPNPKFDQVYPNGTLTYDNTATGNGLSGPSAAANWSFEATLDIEWAYAMAPLAHIVLLATNPAETLGVQGLPNMFKDMRDAIDAYPAGTIFSQSFGTAEQNFGGAAAQQQAAFDQTYQYGIATKHDTFVAASGDEGSGGADKLHKESGTFPYQVVGYPASSPYNLTVGGTQLMYNWTWAPTSSSAYLASGAQNPAFFNSVATPGSITEPVWKESYLGGNDTSAGGRSSVYSLPSWQSQQAPVIGANARGVPDLSWSAAVNGGVLVYITAFPNAIRPGWHITGGTSAGSPQIAGLLADVNSLRAKAGKLPIADPHKAIYSLGNSSSASASYRDITPMHFGTVNFPLVDNQWDGTPTVAGLPVLSGWDMTTGFGSPHADKWVPALAGS
jgi:subtilase family serine protease